MLTNKNNPQKMSGVENKAYSQEDHEQETPPSATDETKHETDVKGNNFNCKSCYFIYVKALESVRTTIEQSFENLARSIIKHPFIWIFGCFLLIALSSLGILRLRREDRSEELYVPLNSQSLHDVKQISLYYHTFENIRLEDLLFFSKSGGNFMTPKCVKEAKDIITKVFKIPGLGDLCIKKPSYMPRFSQFDNGQDCSFLNPFELVRNTSVPLKEFNHNIKSDTTLMSNGKLPVYSEEEMIAKVTWNNGKITSIDMLRIQIYLKNNEKVTDNEKALKWEKAFIDLMQEEAKKLTCASITFAASRTLDDAINASLEDDIILFIVSLVVMMIFACLMIGSCSNPIRGHTLLAILGVILIILGIVAGFGLAMIIGTPLSSVANVLPILVLSIGIDNIFIIVKEYDRQTDTEDPVERIPKTMRHIGATITMAAFTSIMSFSVGISSDFPAISHFCTFAATTFLVEFVLQVTLFVAFLYFDALRFKAKRRECLPIWKAEDKSCCLKSIGDENLSNVIARKFATYLMKPLSKMLVFIAAGGLLAFGIIGCFNVSQEFTRETLVADGDYYLTYIDKIENDFNKGLPISVVKIGLVDYADKKVRDEIRRAATVAFANSYYQSRSISWLDQYQLWSQQDGSINIKGDNFTRALPIFLASPKNVHFHQDIKFDSKGRIIASRTKIFMRPSRKSTFMKHAMLTLRKDFQKSAINLLSFADDYIFLDQYAAVESEVTRNVCLASAAVLVITLPFCIHPVVVLTLVFGFISVIVEVIGLMYFWDVSLNSISMITLVMSVGFAVDYSAHVAHAFITSAKSSPNERAIDALQSIGDSVFLGGTSTVIGMSVTAFASSEVFKIFFRTTFGIVVFGLFNGLVLLPVLFSIVGVIIGSQTPRGKEK